MCIGITSDIIRTSISVYDTGKGPNLIRTSFISLKCRDRIRPVVIVSLRSATDNLVQAIGKIMLFLQLGERHVRVYFGNLDNLAVQLLAGTSFIDSFVKGVFPMGCRIIPIRTRPVAIIRKHTTLSDPLTVSQTHLDSKTCTEDLLDKKNETPRFRVTKRVAIMPNTEASLLVTRSSVGIV